MYNLASTDADRSMQEEDGIVTIQLHDTPGTTRNPLRKPEMSPLDDEEIRAMDVGMKKGLFSNLLFSTKTLHIMYGFGAAFILLVCPFVICFAVVSTRYHSLLQSSSSSTSTSTLDPWAQFSVTSEVEWWQDMRCVVASEWIY